MRISRIRLKDYRGVADRTVEPAPDGVTIVEGPNEVGKSSLVEAIDILFSYLDSTGARRVQALQPVGRAVGPEIEVDIETGPYAFTYRKRFLRKPRTRLEIRKPREELVEGRDAHDRARAILAETIDLRLWEALRVQQGAAVGQADLTGARSLAQALDRAAGQEVSGDREHGLFDAVREEYERYWGKQGHPRKPLKEAAENERGARVEVERIEAELSALERDVDRSAELEREIDDSRRTVRECESNGARRERELLALKEREGEVERLRLAAQSSEMGESVARRELENRRTSIAAADEAAAKREVLEEQAARDEPALEQADRKERDAREALAAAERRAKLANARWELAARDLDFQHAKLDHEQLLERRARIEEAQTRSAAAQEFLERTKIDDALLKQIREAQVALIQAQARLDAGSPRLKARALGPVEAELDGRHKTLEAGAELDQVVADRIVLAVPGALEVEVTAGTSTEELVRARDESRRFLDERLGKAAVEDPDAAEKENTRRADAERTVADCRQAVDDNLRDLSLEEMDNKIQRLRAWVEGYPGERPEKPPLPSGFDAANAAKRAAKQEREDAAQTLDEAKQTYEARSRQARERKNEAYQSDFQLRLAQEAERRATAELVEARRNEGDDALERKFADHVAKAASAGAAHDAARQELQAANPERVRALAETARKAALSAADRLRTSQDELRDVTARLEVRGERGWFEALQEARTEHERAATDHAALTAHANAAKLLFDTMSKERDDARRAYAAPLRDKIDQLGKLVFDETFGVELDDELKIRSRTLRGEELPFESLSVGAQEQLGLVMRLACSLLVDTAEGVPLLFDDTLGHSDPDRLEGMGAMLSRAGEQCQIVLLTCTPDRFRHVAHKKMIRLPAARAPEPPPARFPPPPARPETDQPLLRVLPPEDTPDEGSRLTHP